MVTKLFNPTKDEAKRDIQQFLDHKQPWNNPSMYVEPSSASNGLLSLKDGLSNQRSTFKVVVGKNGEGKSMMLKHIHNLAIENGLAYIDFHFDAWEKKPAFKTGYISEFVQNFYIPIPDEGYVQLLDLYTRDSGHDMFARIAQKLCVVDGGYTDLIDEFRGWPDYAKAFYTWCNPTAPRRVRSEALDYLRGTKLDALGRRNVGVTNMDILKSHHSPEEAILEFYSVLCSQLGLPGLLVTYDEVETLGTLGGQQGRWALTFLRSLENYQFRRLRAMGHICHIILAFTREYIMSSQDTMTGQVGGSRAGGGQFKTLLSDIPRLYRIIGGNILQTNLGDEETIQLLEKFRKYYEYAYETQVNTFDPAEFLDEYKQSGQDPANHGSFLTTAFNKFKES